MKRTITSLGLAAAAFSVAAATGCGSDLGAPSELREARLLAIEVDPLEAGPLDEVGAKATVYVPAGQTLVEPAWSFCPFSAGATAGFACAVPACETPIVAAADGTVRFSPFQTATSCFEQLAQAGSGRPSGAPTEVPEQFEAVLRYRYATEGGATKEAVQRISVWPAGAPEPRNRQPVVTRVEIGGQVATPGALLTAAVAAKSSVPVRVLVDAESLDDYRDASGRELREEAIVSFYATDGKFSDDRSNGTDTTVDWKADPLDEGATEVELWVVVRDLRGGARPVGPFRIALMTP